MSAITEQNKDGPNWDEEYDDGDSCDLCGGEGWIMEADASPSEWGEEDSTITCPRCKGKGFIA